jgi:hypothetical protein
MLRVLLIVLGLSSVAIASEPVGRVIFRIKVVAEEREGAWRDGDTRVGDELALFEKADGAIVAYRFEQNHSMDAKVPAAESETEVPVYIKEVFANSGLHGFDFEQQLEAARKAMHQRNPLLLEPLGIGGTTVEVFADFQGARFQFRCKDLNWVLPFYAPYNDSLGRLFGILETVGAFAPTVFAFTK